MMRTLLVVTATTLGLLAAAAPVHAAAHDVAYWDAIAKNQYAVPAGAKAGELVLDLVTNLGSTDPHLRDDLGYGITAQWVYGKRLLSPDETRALMHQLMGNLTHGIGERGTDSVLLRSFSALDLSLIAALDNAAPFLQPDEYHQLLTAAIDYMGSEKDLRAFDEQKGWMHATAHTADLLKFLARSRHATKADQAAILNALSRRLATATTPYDAGEDERLARVVISLVALPDFDAEGFAQWATTLKAPFPEKPTAQPMTVRANVTHFLLCAYALITADPREAVSKSPARDAVIAALSALG